MRIDASIILAGFQRMAAETSGTDEVCHGADVADFAILGVTAGALTGIAVPLSPRSPLPGTANA